MLQSSKETQNILKLADFIENLSSDQYNQRTYIDHNGGRCICGWVNYLNATMPKEWVQACKYLGVTEDQGKILFAAHPWPALNPTKEQAARVLRHLAVTGEVNWNLS